MSCHLLGQWFSGASGGSGVLSVVCSRLPPGPRPWSHLEERYLERRVSRPSARPKSLRGPACASKPAGPVEAAVPRPSAGASAGGLAGPGRLFSRCSWRLTVRGSSEPPSWNGPWPRCRRSPRLWLSGRSHARAPGCSALGSRPHLRWAFSPRALTTDVWTLTHLHAAAVRGEV